jgi:hypothetical protein
MNDDDPRGSVMLAGYVVILILLVIIASLIAFILNVPG